MSKPHVLSIGYGRHMFSVGNAERERMQQCAAATSAFHMVIFTLASDGLSAEVLPSGLHLYPTNSRNKVCMLLDALLIATRVIKHAPQRPVVTTQDPFASGLIGYLLRIRFKTRWIVQEHGDVFGSIYWRQESWGNWVSYWLGVFLLRQADSVRVVSDRVRNNMLSLGIPAAKLTQLSVAIDLSEFQPKTSFRQATDDEFHFVTVARLVPQKNLSLLLRSFATAWAQQPGLRLLVVGSGPELASIEQQIIDLFPADNNPVTLQGWSNDVASLMRSADAYVLSSNYEGWARVLVESMVTCVPIVTTDVGCATQVVKDGVHGLVVPVADQSALSTALLRMATDYDAYMEYVRNLQQLQPSDIPGTDIDQYGQQWVETLAY